MICFIIRKIYISAMPQCERLQVHADNWLANAFIIINTRNLGQNI